MIDLAEEAEEAYQNVKDYLTGIFGELGNTMSDALVDAFRNGTDAAEAFGESVTEMLENIGAQMIYSTLFSQIIQDANDAMLDTMTNVSLTEEEKFNRYIAILDTMTSGILGQQDTYEGSDEEVQGTCGSERDRPVASGQRADGFGKGCCFGFTGQRGRTERTDDSRAGTHLFYQ